MIEISYDSLGILLDILNTNDIYISSVCQISSASGMGSLGVVSAPCCWEWAFVGKGGKNAPMPDFSPLYSLPEEVQRGMGPILIVI